jgi:hypothetical protein
MSTAPDVTWTVDGIITDGLASSTPDLTRGQEVTFPFVFHATRTVADAAFDERYRDLRAYLEFANGAPLQYGVTNEGVPWFREHIPERAAVDSLVVPIEPGGDVIDAPGVWGLVVGGADGSEPVANLRQLDVDVFVLAERDEYVDKQAVRDDLGSPVI